MEHRYNVRIYYESVDTFGVVFYANYFKFTERARTELIYERLKLKQIMFNELKIIGKIKSSYLCDSMKSSL